MTKLIVTFRNYFANAPKKSSAGIKIQILPGNCVLKRQENENFHLPAASVEIYQAVLEHLRTK